MKYSRLILTFLSLTIVFAPLSIEAKNKKDKKNDRQQVTIQDEVIEPNRISVHNAKAQLYGEWNVIEVEKKPIYMPERAYLLFDFSGGNRLMGHTGCNALNGKFEIKGDKITFKDIVTTERGCSAQSTERSLLKAISDVQGFILTQQNEIQFLTLTDKKGHPVIRLRRQNIDFLNGGWLVKELNGDNVEKRHIKLVADVAMLTINANSGCNIINGVITVDPMKEFAVEFEDLISSHYNCPNLSTETQLLLALEETAYCKRVSDNETALLDRSGKVIVLLKRLTVKQLKN